jgi:PAS domain S-box-containing protein
MELRYWLLTLTPLLALLSYAVLLVMVLRRGLRTRLSRLFSLYLLVMAAWSLGSAMMRLQPDDILFWNKVTTGSAMIMPLAFFAFVQAFVDEKPSSLLWAAIVLLLGLEIANARGLMVANIRLLQGGLISFDARPLTYAMAIFNSLLVGLSLWRLARAHRHASDPVLRNRIRYPLIGASAVLLGGLTNLVDTLAYYPVDHAANLLNAFLLAYAVLRYQLMDISLVFRKGLLHTIPTAIIGVGYFLIISLATTLLHAFAGAQLLVLSLIVAAIAAVAAEPLRDRAQFWIDKLFFREKYDTSLMLQRLSSAAASVLDLNRLTSMILDAITTTMHIERAVFFLRQEESEGFRLMAQRGLDPRTDMRLRIDHPIVDWLSRHNNALTSYDLSLIPQFKALWGEEKEDLKKLGAELFVPLIAKGELVGILVVGPKLSGETYSQDDQLTLITLANQTATALENARLHEETRRRNRELALLNRVIAASATGHNIEAILQTVCQELTWALGVQESTAALFNEERTGALMVTVRSAREPASGRSHPGSIGPQAEGLARILAGDRTLKSGDPVPMTDNPLFQHLLDTQAPLVINDVEADRQPLPIRFLLRQGRTISFLALPLLVQREVAGCLCLDAFQPRPFSTEDVDLVRRVAEQVSGALARARLAQTQQRLSTVVEQAAEAVMITDTNGTILYVNPAFEQISSYGYNELLGRNPRMLKSGVQDDAFYRQLWQAITTGRVWQGRLVNKKKGGTLYTVDTTITPVRNHSGETVNYVATMRDVTREVQLEEQFHQSQKMEALGRLAGGIAHDFNNLLTVIELSTRLLQRQMQPDDPSREHVERIQDTGQRASRLTSQLLRFSRREIIEPQVLNLSALVGDLSKLLRRIIGEDIRLVTSTAAGLWPVKADPAQMEQVIMNLVVNSRDAMPDGGILTIETVNTILDGAYVAVHPDAKPGKHVMLVVRDTGMGMTDEVKAHLFEPFFTTKGQGQGTGLGLPTVFGIVKQNEGHIEVHSQAGQGTTFRVYLPRSDEIETAAPPRTTPASTAKGTETILVVEDETEVRDLTVRTLATQGYQVLAAEHGQEALQISRAHDGPIHLLLTDVIMPQTNVNELVRGLQSERPETRVLYMSGYVDLPLVEKFASDPDIAFLPKPFNVESLTQKIKSVLEAEV